MESAGEVVAIVRALRDAGLAVAFTDDSRQVNSVFGVNRPIPQRHTTHSQTDTCGTKNRHCYSQIRDGTYASSYQLAHCHVNPTSPPVRSSEFPPQKVTFCPYQGNFDTGSYDIHSSDASPVRDSEVYRNDVSWSERGIPQRTPRIDAFADSLRRYPAFSPETLSSSDIIQRLLAYTQSKSLTKPSHHSKSTRSLRKSETKISSSRHRPSSNNINTLKQEFNASTNTEIRKCHIQRPVVKSDLKTPASTNKTFGNIRNSEKLSMYKPVAESSEGKTLPARNDSKNVRLNQMTTTYDYLNSPSRHISPCRPSGMKRPATEVHYLDDLSRYVKDTLKNIYEEQTVVCPKIAKRYSQHRKECQKQHHQSSSDSVNFETQTPVGTRDFKEASSSKRSLSPRISQHSYPQTCCFCQKPLPCGCRRSSFERKSSFKYPKSILPPPTCKFSLYLNEEEKEDTCPCPDDDHKKIEDAVFQWLKQVPVNADYTPEDRAVREEIAKDLANTLTELKDNENFETRAREEILKCLNYMPMWRPDKGNYESFINQIADNLLEILLDAVKILDEFDDEVTKWVEELPLKRVDGNGQIVDRKQVKEYVINKLKPVALNRPPKDDVYTNALKSEIRDILDEIPVDVKNDRNKDNILNQFADKLVAGLTVLPEVNYTPKDRAERDVTKILENVHDFDALNGLNKQKMVQNLGNKLKELQALGLSENEIKEEMDKAMQDAMETISLQNNLEEDFKDEIKDWVSDIPEISTISKKKEFKHSIQKLTTNLADLGAQGIENEDVESEIRNETKAFLDTVSKKENIAIDVRRENKLTDNLIDKLIPVAKRAEKEGKAVVSLKQGFQGDIKDWIGNLPELSNVLKNKENHKTVQDLTKKLVELQKEGIEDENVTDEINEEVKTWLNTTLDKNSHMTLKAKAKLTQGLTNRLVVTAKKEELKSDVKDWVGDISEIPKMSELGEDQLAIPDFVNKLTNLQKGGLQNVGTKEQIREEAKMWLDSALKNNDVQMSPQAKQKLADSFLEKLNDSEMKGEFKMEIKEWINDIPEISGASTRQEHKRPVQRLAEKLVDLQKQGIEDQNVQGEMKREAEKLLESALEKVGAHLPPKEKAKLAEKLLTRLIEKQSKGERLEFLEEDINKEIKDWLEVETNVNDRANVKEITKKNNMRVPNSNEGIEKIITEWLDEIPGLSNASKNKRNKEKIQDLAFEVLSLRKLNVNYKEFKDKIVKYITDFLESILESEGARLTSRNKNTLIDNLANDLIGSVKQMEVDQKSFELSNMREKELGSMQHTFENEIKDWLDDIPEVSNASRNLDNKNAISTLAQEMYMRINKIGNENTKEGIIGKIRDFLNFLLDKEGAALVTKAKNVLINDLLNRLVSLVKATKVSRGLEAGTESGNEGIVEWLDGAIDANGKKFSKPNPQVMTNTVIAGGKSIDDDEIMSSPKIISPRLSKDSKRSISVIIERKSLEPNKSDEIKKDIFIILKRNVTDIPDEEVELIAENIIRQAQCIYSKQSESDEAEMIRKEVKEVLDNFGIDKNRKELEKCITELLTDEIVRGVLDDQTRASMYNVFKDTSANHNASSERADRLMKRAGRINETSAERANRMSISSRGFKIMDTSAGSSEDVFLPSDKQISTGNVTPMQKRAFQELAKREITNFVEENIENATPRTKIKITEATDQVVQELGNIVFDPDLTPEMKTETMKNEVTEYLKRVPLQTDESERDIANEIVNNLQNKLNGAGIFTSTPRKSSLKSYPRSLVENTLLSSIREDDESGTMKNNEQRYTSRLKDTINNWINDLPMVQDKVKDINLRNTMVNDLATDIVDRQKYLQLNPEAKFSYEEELEHLKYQVFKWLNKMLDISDLTPFLPNITDLMEKIRKIPVVSLIKPSSKAIQEEISKYIAQVPSNLYIQKDKNHLQQMAKELGDKVLSDINKPDADLTVDNDIARWMPKVFNTDKSELNRMANTLKIILKKKGLLDNKQDIKTYKSAADILYDIIVNWCEDLPIYGGESPEDQEKIKTLKQNLASKLINKIGELNLNPEVFNDNFLYDDLLIDEIDKLLSMVPKNPELEKYLPALKRDLIAKVKEAKQKIMDELAGQAYKQQLRDAISTSVCLPECLPPDEMASFELLKDNLVDAFISLHFITDNEHERDRLKKKIADEVNRFCNEYLRRHPLLPIDPKILNQDLYNALLRVPIPKDESMRSEVEQLRVKEIISDWIKKLPLKDETISEILQRNKMVSILAKRLQEIENLKESNPDFDSDSKMFEEILKWLNKIPLKPGNESDIPRMADRLIEQLKDTEESRKFNSVYSASGCCCTSQCIPSGGATGSLTQSEKAHLHRIRERVCSRSQCFKDACVNPPPMDASSQTDVRPWQCPVASRLSPPVCPKASSWNSVCPERQSLSRICADTRESPCEISPQVIIREYLWDSTSPKPLCTTQGSPCRSSQGIQPCLSPKPCKPGPSGSPRNSACKCCPQQTETRAGIRINDNNQSCQKTPEVSSAEEVEETRGPCNRNRSREFGRPKRKTKSRDEESEWCSIRFPDNTDFWDASKRHSRVCVPTEFKPFTRERERQEEKHKCRCKERVMYSPCRSRNRSRSREKSCDEVLKERSKCCGVNCPHPSYLFFR